MVRSIVGTLVEVGRGRYPADVDARGAAVEGSCARRATAPACGLFLVRVEYERRRLEGLNPNQERSLARLIMDEHVV